MNRGNDFDELARRKLEERSFPCQESDWQQAQVLLTRRQRHGVRIWPWALGLLLLAGSAVWWLSGARDTSAPPSATADTPYPGTPSSGTVQGFEKNDGTLANATSDTGQHTSTPSVSMGTAAPPDTVPSNNKPASGSLAAAPAYARAANSRMAAYNSSKPAAPGKTIAVQGEKADPTIAATTLNPKRPVSPASGGTSNDGLNNEDKPFETGYTPPMSSPGEAGATTPHGLDTTPIPVQPTGTSDQPTFNWRSSNTTTPTVVDTTRGLACNIFPTAPPDSSYSGNDSVASVPPAPLPLQGPTIRSPWEISALAGLRSTNAKYSGAAVQPDELRIIGQHGPILGLEAMHTGRNLSLGAGISLGTWSEQVDVTALDRTRTTIRPYWTLVPVDTTFLLITDTLFEGTDSMSYAGISVPGTLNILQRRADTTTVTERLREARTVTVRSGYVEVTPLIDLHVTQARWTLGLRGGPTVGLLSGRRGELPSPGDDGRAPFREVAFREVVLGYHARAYVRYRWNAAWSVGLEPLVGGTLLDTFNGYGLERRNNGYGCVVSLTYRLP